MAKDILFKTIMLKGEAGSSITSIEKTGSVGNVDTYTIHFNDDTPDYSFEVTNGYSIISIEKTSTLGNIDTYTVTLDNGETYTFDVHNANVANSMTAADETTVAPSIAAVKSYGGDGDGILFCGDFVNIPISNKSHFRDNRALGWTLPDWLEWGDWEGLHVKKDYQYLYTNFATPQYIATGYKLSDLGVNSVVISVEWAKLVNAEYEIHTSTKVINDTSGSVTGRAIMELETGVTFALYYLYSTVWLGCSSFAIYKDNVPTITGDYYIRKIKIEKGTIATPFGLNKDQFLASSIYKNLPEFFEGYVSGTTDANGYYLSSIDISTVGNIENLIIVGVAVRVGNNSYFSGYSTDNVQLEYKLELDPNTNKTWLHISFHDPSNPNKQVKTKLLYYFLKNPFATS